MENCIAYHTDIEAQHNCSQNSWTINRHHRRHRRHQDHHYTITLVLYLELLSRAHTQHTSASILKPTLHIPLAFTVQIRNERCRAYKILMLLLLLLLFDAEGIKLRDRKGVLLIMHTRVCQLRICTIVECITWLYNIIKISKLRCFFCFKFLTKYIDQR